MNRKLLLEQQKAALTDAANAIIQLATTEGRGLTVEERATVKAKTTEAEGIAETLTLEARAAASSNIPGDRSPGRTHNNAEDAPFGREAVSGETPKQRQLRVAHAFGEFLGCVRNAATTPSAIDPRLQKRAALGSSETAPGDGGFLVGTDSSQEILQEMHEVGVLAPRCTEIPISNNSNGIEINGVNETSRANGSRWGGVQSYWANEAGTTTASKPTFRKVETCWRNSITTFIRPLVIWNQPPAKTMARRRTTVPVGA